MYSCMFMCVLIIYSRHVKCKECRVSVSLIHQIISGLTLEVHDTSLTSWI